MEIHHVRSIIKMQPSVSEITIIGNNVGHSNDRSLSTRPRGDDVRIIREEDDNNKKMQQKWLTLAAT